MKMKYRRPVCDICEMETPIIMVQSNIDANINRGDNYNGVAGAKGITNDEDWDDEE